MEYAHKLMRGTVSAIINKALRDIGSDPKRSIRNLADLGELFSTSQTQKHFFELVHSILRNPGNPYNELLIKMIRNVNLNSVRALSLNFGYSAMSYGSERLRRYGAEYKKQIPWVLILDFRNLEGERMDSGRIASILSEAVKLGIYTHIFLADNSQDVQTLLKVCKEYPECVFFAAAAPELLTEKHMEQMAKNPNLIVSVDATEPVDEAAAAQLFRRLNAAGCFFGYHVYYNQQNIQQLISDDFTRKMIRNGCLVGTYVNTDCGLEELENQAYQFACSKRGKNGKPLFTIDFYRDINYVGNSISCGNHLVIRGDGKVPGCPANLKQVSLSELIKSEAVFG